MGETLEPLRLAPKPVFKVWGFVLALCLGLTIGVFTVLFLFTVEKKKSLAEPKGGLSLQLPSGAIEVQSCSAHRGALFVKPQDIPVGPVYMVNNGQVVGIEFMISQEKLLAGESFKDLGGLGVKTDHLNIGLLSKGHAGYPIPHYHVDLYTVTREVEEAIRCPVEASPSANQATPSQIVK